MSCLSHYLCFKPTRTDKREKSKPISLICCKPDSIHTHSYLDPCALLTKRRRREAWRQEDNVKAGLWRGYKAAVQWDHLPGEKSPSQEHHHIRVRGWSNSLLTKWLFSTFQLCHAEYDGQLFTQGGGLHCLSAVCYWHNRQPDHNLCTSSGNHHQCNFIWVSLSSLSLASQVAGESVLSN